MIAPIAHAGHWALNLLYIAPVLVVVGVLGVQSMRDRRELRREGGGERRPPLEPPDAL